MRYGGLTLTKQPINWLRVSVLFGIYLVVLGVAFSLFGRSTTTFVVSTILFAFVLPFITMLIAGKRWDEIDEQHAVEMRQRHIDEATRFIDTLGDENDDSD